MGLCHFHAGCREQIALPSVPRGAHPPSVQPCLHWGHSQPGPGLPATWQWKHRVHQQINGPFSADNAPSLLWLCSALIHIYWFGGLIPLIFPQLFAQLQLPSVMCNELHENKEWVYEKDMKTMTEQDPHYRCLLLIPEYQTQTAFVSHTLQIWHNPKLTWGDRNPPIDFSTFQSRAKAGEVISYQITFPLFNKEHLKSHFQPAFSRTQGQTNCALQTFPPETNTVLSKVLSFILFVANNSRFDLECCLSWEESGNTSRAYSYTKRWVWPPCSTNFKSFPA